MSVYGPRVEFLTLINPKATFCVPFGTDVTFAIALVREHVALRTALAPQLVLIEVTEGAIRIAENARALTICFAFIFLVHSRFKTDISNFIQPYGWGYPLSRHFQTDNERE